MNIFKSLNPLAFLISFCFGIFICYVKKPVKRVVYRHPTPFNAGKIEYRDDNNQCFKYFAEEVPCPEDKRLINEHPIEVK